MQTNLSKYEKQTEIRTDWQLDSSGTKVATVCHFAVQRVSRSHIKTPVALVITLVVHQKMEKNQTALTARDINEFILIEPVFLFIGNFSARKTNTPKRMYVPIWSPTPNNIMYICFSSTTIKPQESTYNNVAKTNNWTNDHSGFLRFFNAIYRLKIENIMRIKSIKNLECTQAERLKNDWA